MSAPQEIIGGRTFSFGMLPAKVSFRVQIGLVKIIGEPLFKMIVGTGAPSIGAAISVLQADPTAALGGMGILCDKLSADEMEVLAETMFSTIRLSQTVEGKSQGVPVTFETFQGRPKELWLVTWKALQVNFAGFFPDADSSSSPSAT